MEEFAYISKDPYTLRNANLGNKLSDPLTGQNHFWTAYMIITNKKGIPPVKGIAIFHLLLMMVSLSLITKGKRISLTNTLQTNVLEMLMIVFYRILFPKPMHRSTMCL